MDAREDGVYITYTPVVGADAVTKKLGSPTIIDAITGITVAGQKGTKSNYVWSYISSSVAYNSKRGIVAAKDDNTIIISLLGVKSSQNEGIFFSDEPIAIYINARNYSTVKLISHSILSGWGYLKLFDSDNSNALIRSFDTLSPIVDITAYDNVILTVTASDNASFVEVELI